MEANICKLYAKLAMQIKKALMVLTVGCLIISGLLGSAGDPSAYGADALNQLS